LKMKKAIQLDDKDNVATVTDDVSKGEQVEVLNPMGEVILDAKPVEDIIFGHKLALRNLGKGETIIKYGEVIGVASKPIAVGGWVHIHNVESGRLPTSELEVDK
jgi:altronate dehydratase small subunit